MPRIPLNSRSIVYLACAAVVCGSIGPWRVSLVASSSGLSSGGLFCALLAGLAAVLLVPRKPWAAVPMVLGGVCAAIAAVAMIDIAGASREAIGDAPPSVEAGWGLWLTLMASVFLTVAAYHFQAQVTGRRISFRVDARHALIGLLVIGLFLRILLCLVWSPAMTGYSDSGVYFAGAVEFLWTDPIRMIGYSMFVSLLHAVTPHLLAVVVVQHALGLLAAAVAFFMVRRSGGPQWLGLVPAAVLALGGGELFLEHAALSDALFVFFMIIALYAAVRASQQDSLWWGGLAGLAGALAVWDRTVGLGIVVVISVWLLFSIGRPTRRTLAVAGVSLLVALVTIGAYAAWRTTATDYPGVLTSNNAWNLYGRIAPVADCEKFSPPPGSEPICETIPPSRRGYTSGEWYIFSPESPAQRLYGPPYVIPSDPLAMENLQAWSEAAIKGQPLAYLDAVWHDARRLFRPNLPSYGQLSADGFVAFLLYGPDRHSGNNEFVEYWQSRLYPGERVSQQGNIQPFKVWEAATRIVNLPMILLLVLTVASPWVLAGRARSGAILFGATALMLLFFPIVTKSYDYRFVIAAFAPLVSAGALSAWGLSTRLIDFGSSPEHRGSPEH